MLFNRRANTRHTRQAAGRLPMNYYRSNTPRSSPATWRGRGYKDLARLIIKRTADSVALLLILVLIVYSLMVNPSPKVTANNNAYHSTDTYRQSLIAILKSVKNRTKVTFDEAGIIKSMQSRYPEISGARIHLPLIGQKPSIKLEIAEPSFQLTSSGRAYLVDAQGLVVANATDYPSIKGLPVLADNSGFAVEIAKPALDSSGVNFVVQLLAQLKNAKIPIKSLSLPTRPQELDLTTTDRAYFVKFYLAGEPLTQIGQYLAARHQFAKTNSQPFQYLDVRVAGKIFYR